MKFSPRTFRSEWDLHAWSGVISSLFLFVVFFCGVFALFHRELMLWQDPELSVRWTSSAGDVVSYDASLKLLEERGLVPRGASVGLAPIAGSNAVNVWLRDETDTERQYTVDAGVGSVRSEQSRLAEELYFMHFFYRVPGGTEFSGVLAACLFIALISGTVIHLKDLKRQWWQFRPRLTLRYASSDIHKVLGVFGLPFATLFAWSGAVLGLFSLVSSGIAGAAFQGDANALTLLRGESEQEHAPMGRSGASLSVEELIARGRAAFPGKLQPVSFVELEHYGDAASIARLFFERDLSEPEKRISLDASSGAVLQQISEASYAGSGFERVLFDLHYASYGGLLVKALYALLAFGVCAVIVTGNLVWIERRDPLRESVGNRLIERLTLGVTAGLGLGVGAYFLANRTLPIDVVGRATLEFATFLGVWLSGVLALLVLPAEPRRIGGVLCIAAGVTFLAVVLFDLLFLRASLLAALDRGDPDLFAVEGLLLLLGIGAGGFATLLLSKAQYQNLRPEPEVERASSFNGA